jgi:hypothetical protein
VYTYYQVKQGQTKHNELIKSAFLSYQSLANVVCRLLNAVCRLLNAAKVETNTSLLITNVSDDELPTYKLNFKKIALDTISFIQNRHAKTTILI